MRDRRPPRRHEPITVEAKGIAPKRVFVEPNSAFLCSIYQMLEENDIPPTRIQVHTRMGISYPASNERLLLLERADLVSISADNGSV